MRVSTLLFGLVLAGTAAVAPGIASEDMTTLVSTKGKVASVDAKAGSVTVTIAGTPEGPATDLCVAVDKDTKIIKDGNKIAIGDLNPGDEVMLSYRMTGTETVAVNIGVQSKRG